MRHCNKCKELLIVGENWRESSKRHWDYSCNVCNLKKQQDYRKTDVGQAVLKKYDTSNKGRATKKRFAKLYALTVEGRVANRQKTKKYFQTKKGKEAKIKSENKRKRKYGFIKLFPNPFDKNEPIEWHHICNTFVVALPKEIHNYCKPNGVNAHKKMLRPIVNEIYFSVQIS